MKLKTLVHGLAGAGAMLSLILVLGAKPQDGGGDPMSEMMAQAAKWTAPGEKHKILERFLGEWETEMKFTMAGMDKMPPSKGTSNVSWLMEGRWLKSESTGSMMGMPMNSFMILGYDNFKKSFRATMINSIDTAMLVSEGDLTQKEDVLITYGTLDEYLTGEHDKMVKYVWRFLNEDEILFEVHDLPIGEENTKVFEIRSKRKK